MVRPNSRSDGVVSGQQCRANEHRISSEPALFRDVSDTASPMANVVNGVRVTSYVAACKSRSYCKNREVLC